MPSASTTLQVGEHEVRVSSPDRVVYAATDRTPEITKLQVCEYVAALAPTWLRSIGDRPTAMERWPDGWREGMRLATGPRDKDGDGFHFMNTENYEQLQVAADVVGDAEAYLQENMMVKN